MINDTTLGIAHLADLCRRGAITEETLILYGISGDLPDPDRYHMMSPDRQRSIWTGRMEKKLGPNWRTYFTSLPFFLREVKISSLGRHNWLKEGF